MLEYETERYREQDWDRERERERERERGGGGGMTENRDKVKNENFVIRQAVTVVLVSGTFLDVAWENITETILHYGDKYRIMHIVTLHNLQTYLNFQSYFALSTSTKSNQDPIFETW